MTEKKPKLVTSTVSHKFDSPCIIPKAGHLRVMLQKYDTETKTWKTILTSIADTQIAPMILIEFNYDLRMVSIVEDT